MAFKCRYILTFKVGHPIFPEIDQNESDRQPLLLGQFFCRQPFHLVCRSKPLSNPFFEFFIACRFLSLGCDLTCWRAFFFLLKQVSQIAAIFSREKELAYIRFELSESIKTMIDQINIWRANPQGLFLGPTHSRYYNAIVGLVICLTIS